VQNYVFSQAFKARNAEFLTKNAFTGRPFLVTSPAFKSPSLLNRQKLKDSARTRGSAAICINDCLPFIKID
jgi:hypothetical protein